MKKHIRQFLSTWAHAIVVIIICVILLAILSVVLMPKIIYYMSPISPEQETFSEFYDLPEDSLDVVFLGSSHVYNGINPVVLYQETGLTSCDMAFSSLDMGSSYYMLEEVYRFQSPEYVMLDCYYISGEVFSNDKVYNRLTECMEFSEVKYDYIREWTERDDEKSLFEGIFPFYTYHQRWSELSSDDFLYGDYVYAMNGYIPSGRTTAYDRASYYDEYEFDAIADENMAYLEKIRDLCEEHGTTLIMINIPYQNACESKTAGIQEIADELGVTYLDFNEEALFDSIGLDLERDFLNENHLNTSGATKMTQTLAQWFMENASVETPSAEDEDIARLWDDEVALWERDCDMYLLLRCMDMDTYLSLLDDDRYLIFMTTTKFSADVLSEEQLQQLEVLGCTCSFDEDKGAYLGVYQSGRALTQGNNTDAHSFEGEADGISYYIYTDGTTGNIVIDGVEYSVNASGINFVIYDTVTERVIDAVCFDTSDDLTASGSYR